MVKALSAQARATIKQAIHDAEKVTGAHIALVTSPASDSYHDIIMLYGIILGSLIASGLWINDILQSFPLLLMVQLGSILLLWLPEFRSLPLRLVPKRLAHHRAAHRAFAEYLYVSRHAHHEAPVVLLYISLAERYVHILPSREIRAKIPDENWNAVIAEFTAAMRGKGLEPACLSAVNAIAQKLAPHFPPIMPII